MFQIEVVDPNKMLTWILGDRLYTEPFFKLVNFHMNSIYNKSSYISLIPNKIKLFLYILAPILSNSM
jgi:hypothetical protein